MNNLGYFYEKGIGVEKDVHKAFSLYKHTAENGSSYGQQRLAYAYFYGIGTPVDGDLAIYWMTKAKENGNESAKEALENMIWLVRHNNGQSREYWKSNSTTTILMEKRNSVYYVPCRINGEKADFIFDTGAGMISLSSDFAVRLIDLGLLTLDDVLGEAESTIADGSTHTVTVVNIRDVEIGGLHLYNVQATIKEQQNAPLLLGQSAIEKLGKVTIDGYKLIIHK